MEAKKREQIAILLCVGNGPKEIMKIVKTTRVTILAVRRQIEGGAGPHPPPRKPRMATKRTPHAVAAVRRKIKADPLKSITKIVEEVGMHQSTASRLFFRCFSAP